jgi:DNA-binding transcriptional MerR regulator
MDIKNLKDQKYIGAVQLADEAARLIEQFVPRQERGSVSELPDERMVRYYSTEGLISPPEARQGSAAVYGYTHLLQMLAVKRLQADHLPIRKIREIVENRSDAELEQLLGVGGPARRSEKPANRAVEYLESLLHSSGRRAAAPTPRVALSAPAYSPAASAWARIEIEPGLELHVRQDYRLPDDVKEKQRLARRILAHIESHQ